MTLSYEKILSFSTDIAHIAGEKIIELRLNNTNKIEEKGTVRDLVTTADYESERIILEAIRKKYPEHKILSEESANNLSAEHFTGPLWVVDPIDGTINYANNHLQVGISIGYLEDGVARVGVVHSPFQRETFSAISGQGAKLNGQSIHVVESPDLESAMVGTGFPYDRTYLPDVVRRVEAVLASCQGLRRLGAASLDLCWVACGRFQAYFEPHLSPWDIAAGVLIAKEAGAVIGNYETAPYRDRPADLNGFRLYAATPGIADAFHEILI